MANNETISVSIDALSLSRIDLLVGNGDCADRADFVAKAVQDALERQKDKIDQIRDQKDGSFGGDSEVLDADFFRQIYNGGF